MPFFPVQNKSWRVNGFLFPARGIISLPLRPRLGRKRIAPAEVVPVIDVKRDRNKILPEPRLIFQITQPRFRGQTTAAPFRCVELEQMRPRRFAFENDLVGARADGEQKREEKRRRSHHVNYCAMIDCASFAINAQERKRGEKSDEITLRITLIPSQDEGPRATSLDLRRGPPACLSLTGIAFQRRTFCKRNALPMSEPQPKP